MDIKSAPSTTATARATPADAKAELQQSLAKLNKFIQEGPGGIFKSISDFMKTLPTSKEILLNIK